jgi:hypothetical protein
MCAGAAVPASAKAADVNVEGTLEAPVKLRRTNPALTLHNRIKHGCGKSGRTTESRTVATTALRGHLEGEMCNVASLQ